MYGDQADEHTAELAFHFGEAEPVLGIAKLVHYLLVAGERALAGYAYQDALAHYQRGLAAKAGQPKDGCSHNPWWTTQTHPFWRVF